MAIGQEKGSGTWWKVLLGVVGGFFLGIGAVAGGAAIAGTVVKTGTLLGGNADKFLSKEYQEKTILQIVMDAVGGNIKVETLGDLNNITPLVGEYVTGVKGSLNDLGCELTNEEMYTWPLSSLADSIIGSVKNAKIVRVLSKDNIKYPDPIIKFLSYETYPAGDPQAGEYKWATDEQGNYIYDEDGEHVLIDQHLTDMLDHHDYIQKKVDTMKIKMLFKESEIAKSPLLTAIKDKTVNELSKEGAFDDVELGSVIKIDSSSPKILKTFAKNHTTIGNMNDAINNLYLDDVIDSDPSSPVMKKLLGVNNATELLPHGPKITSFPYDLIRMELDSTGKKPKKEYEFVVFSDGEGHESNYIPFEEIVGEKNSTTGKFDGFENITIDSSAKGYTLSGAVSRDDDKLDAPKAIRTNLVRIANVTTPSDWGKNLFVLSCNKRTKVNNLGSGVDGLKLKDAMEIGIEDSLWRVRNQLVSDGDIVKNLTIDDVLSNRADTKFLKNIPEGTKVTEIGEAVNNIKLIKAFDDNIFDGAGDSAPINATWKYMLAETPAELAGLKGTTRGNNPLSTYNCKNYRIGGTDEPGDPGINQMITNMTNNITTATLNDLSGDGIITGLSEDFLNTNVPTVPTKYTPAEGKDKFGKLTIKELSEFITAVYSS